jgi:hypothetical protein
MRASEWVRQQLGAEPYNLVTTVGVKQVPGLGAPRSVLHKELRFPMMTPLTTCPECTIVMYMPAPITSEMDARDLIDFAGSLRYTKAPRVLIAIEAGHPSLAAYAKTLKGKRIFMYVANTLVTARGSGDIMPGGFNAVMKNTRSTPVAVPGLLSLFTDPFASGMYGRCYRVVVTPKVRLALQGMMASASYKTLHGMPAVGSTVVLKAQAFNSGYVDWEDFVKSNVQESTMHRQLSTSKGRGCTTLAGATLCPSKVVPRFYFSGMTARSDGKQFFLTCMANAPGVTMNTLKKTRKAGDAQTYVAVELAATTLWAAGVVHADAHGGNIIVDPENNKVTIVDFAFGVRMTPAVRDRVRMRLTRMVRGGAPSLGSVWQAKQAGGVGLKRYVNGVMATRNRDWYNDDGAYIRALYSALPPDQARLVPSIRARYFGAQPRRRSAR